MDSKEAKGFKPIHEIEAKMLCLNVNLPLDEQYVNKEKKQRFELKSIVFCTTLKAYVQLKKFDESKMVYQCRYVEAPVLKDKEEPKDIEVAQDDLTKEIKVQVIIVDADAATQGHIKNTLALTVGVNDKLSKVTSIELSGGFMTFNGKLITTPDEITFSKL